MELNPIIKKLAEKNYSNKVLLTLIVGGSGGGKSTLERVLNERGYKSVISFTTRPKRNEEDTGHIFVSKENFDKLPNKVAYTLFDGNEYCATKEQVDEADIYIIDPDGVDTLRELYKTDREIVVVYLCTREELRRARMLARGDSEEQVEQRLANDNEIFTVENIRPDVILNGNTNISSVVEQFEEVYGTLLLNAKLNKLDREEGICRSTLLDPRLP